MTDGRERIEDLRRRVHKDPASIAFAQLAEELRRAGETQEAVDASRAGLKLHPTYLSARVTLGRALVELNELDEAEVELQVVLKGAPENLAALRTLGEIHHRRGALDEALAHYKMALSFAPNDPDLQATVNDLARKVEPAEPLIQMQTESVSVAPPPEPPPPAPVLSAPLMTPAGQSMSPAAAVVEILSAPESLDPEREHAVRQIDALEHWLDAIHVARPHDIA
jgi:tetratricopeptide (TPR) repeat protein